jgi:hypothetical protein
MTCTNSRDPYAIAEGMRQEEAELMRQLVDKAKERAQVEASNNGWGPNRTSAYVEKEMLEARNVAHDRFLLEQIKKGLVDREHAKAHNLDLNKLGI